MSFNVQLITAHPSKHDKPQLRWNPIPTANNRKLFTYVDVGVPHKTDRFVGDDAKEKMKHLLGCLYIRITQQK